MVDKKDARFLAFFFVLTCLYFHDIFLKGALLAVEDGFQYYYPMMIAMTKQYKGFTFPFWNPLQYSGFPLFASMEAGALYPLNVILPLIFEPFWAFNLNLIIHYSLAGFFTFLYARQIGLPVFASLMAGTLFSLLGYLPAHLNHQSVINAAVWIPLIFYFFERLRTERNIKYSLYAALAIALQVFAGHPQISLYTYAILFLYVAFHFFDAENSHRLKFAASCALSLLLGWFIALPQIAAAHELSVTAARAEAGYEFFSSYAFPFYKITTFLFPFFYYYGGSYSGEMWGPTPELGQEAFVGTLPFLLAVLVLAKWRKHREILFWGIVILSGFLLALGDGIPLLNRLLYHVPGYNAFRGPSKHLLEVSLGLSILAGFGFSSIQGRGKRFNTALLKVLSLSAGAFLVIFGLFDQNIRAFFKDFFSNMRHFQLHWDRADIPVKALSLTDASVYIPLITISVYFFLLLAYFKAAKKLTGLVLLAGVFIVIFIEAQLWKINDIPQRGMVENYNRELYSLLSQFRDGRTVFLAGDVPPLTAIPYGVSLVEGYESLELGDYKKIFPTMYSQPPRVWRAVLDNNSVLSMMNAKYIFVSAGAGGVEGITRYTVPDWQGKPVPLPPTAGAPATAVSHPVYKKIAAFTGAALYENSFALPRAYPATGLIAADSADELRMRLFTFLINPWFEAAVSTRDLQEIGVKNFSPGEVRIQEDRPAFVALSARFSGQGFVVLSDQFYPGWEARIDGQPAKIYRTNVLFRGVVVPAGEHTIVFEYVPRMIYACMAASGAALLAMVLFLFVKSRRQEKEIE